MLFFAQKRTVSVIYGVRMGVLLFQLFFSLNAVPVLLIVTAIIPSQLKSCIAAL
jgi:hypothetical protein